MQKKNRSHLPYFWSFLQEVGEALGLRPPAGFSQFFEGIKKLES
jgi:hypothetical protein